MEKSHSRLDRHFDMPGIRTVGNTRPLQWLRMGWEDVLQSPLASLAYGVTFALLGYSDPRLRGRQALSLHRRSIGLSACQAARCRRPLRDLASPLRG